MDRLPSELTLTATEFRAKCLDILKRLGEHQLARVTVTWCGKPVAVITPPPISEAEARAVHGSMAGTVRVAPGLDLTAPAFEDVLDAASGILHV